MALTNSAPLATAAAATSHRAAATEPVLRVESLGIHFTTPGGGVARVVDGASFVVNRQEIFGIAGESGSGKTTLVEAILQIIRFPNRTASGKVLFQPKGQAPVDLMRLSPRAMRQMRWRHISYVPQGSMNSLNPIARVGQQLVDGMTAHGVGERQARRRVPDLLDHVGLESRVARLYPHELSGGMKQRCIIAAAIALEPDLMITDEPTTALDVNVQRVILETLGRLRRELGVAILTVSHDLPVHAQLADRIGIMYAGQVVEIGPIRPALKEPLHPYTQGLMAAIPAIGGERKRLAGIPGSPPSPSAWPSGCRFHARCPKALPICPEVAPILAPVPDAGDGAAARLVSCHLYPTSTPEAAR